MSESNYKTLAFEELKVHARKTNDKDALYEVANRYLTGENCPKKNKALAKAYIVKAAKAGNIDAINDFINRYYDEDKESFVEICEYCVDMLQMCLDGAILEKYEEAKKIKSETVQKTTNKNKREVRRQGKEIAEPGTQKKENRKKESCDKNVIEENATLIHEILSLDGTGKQYYYNTINEEIKMTNDELRESLDYLVQKGIISIKDMKEETFFLCSVIPFKGKYVAPNPKLRWIRNHRFLLGILLAVFFGIIQNIYIPLGWIVTTIGCIAIWFATFSIIPKGEGANGLIKAIENYYGYNFGRRIYLVDSSSSQLRIGEYQCSYTFRMSRRVFREFSKHCLDTRNDRVGSAFRPEGTSADISLDSKKCTLFVYWNNF